jgi:hypothetical protein
MRSTKDSHLITVQGAQYRWRATGNDNYITVVIWPVNNIGPCITGNFGYHHTMIDQGGGCYKSAGDQLIVTSRLIRRILEHAVASHGYDSAKKGRQLNLKALEDVIKWDDALRASRP